MRHISCALTTRQVLDRSKTVSRRLGWRFAKPGMRLQIDRKCMGLKKGEHPEKLATVELVCVRFEPLCIMLDEPYGHIEAKLEGFPSFTGKGFVEMFTREMRCPAFRIITRLQWVYLD